MNQFIFLGSLGYCLSAFAFVSSNDALSARSQAMQRMQAFHPQSIPSFTEHPPEVDITVSEGDNKTLSALGAARVNENDAARFVATQEKTRQKVYPGKDAFDFEERLLENPEAVLNASCHMEPQPCEESIALKKCEERTQFESRSCGDALSLSVKTHRHPEMTRVVVAPMLTVNLTECSPKHELSCSPKHLITLHEHCERLDVKVTLKGNVIPLLKQPTCSDPTIVLNDPSSPPLFKVVISVDEKISESHWMHQDCNSLSLSCIPDQLNQCIDANMTKIIDGVSITRTCWGIQST